MTPEERKADWQKRRRQQDWARRQAQQRQPTRPPVPTGQNPAVGAARGYLGLTAPVEAAGDIISGALTGDFEPLKEVGRGVGLRAGQLYAASQPGGAGAVTATQAAIDEERARRERRQFGQGNLPAIRRAVQEAQLAKLEAQDPSLRGRLTRGAVSTAIQSAPYVATGGSVPALATVGALSSLGEPEDILVSAALAMAPAPPVKFIAPVLRRIRGGRGAAAAAAETVTPGFAESAVRSRWPRQRGAPMMRLPEGGNVPKAGELPRGFPAEPELPPLEADLSPRAFGVRAAPELPYKETVGPPLREAAEFSLRDSSLATKAERTPILEVISAARKAGLLTSIKTHLRNVAGTGAFQISEELARMPGAVVDMLLSGVTKRRTLTGPSLDSMLRSFEEAATKGWKEAKEVMRRGITQADIERLGLNKEINSGSKILDAYINFTFRTLSAEDKLMFAYAQRRALESRAKALALTEMRAGKISRGQVGERAMEILKKPPEDLAAAAAADAEIAVFTNENLVSKFLGAGRREIEKLPGGRGATFGVDLIFPFTKTPTNIIARMLDYAGYGAAKESTKAIARRIVGKSMTEAQQFAFSQAWGRAGIGGGLIALGAYGYNHGWLTGFIEDDPGRRERDEASGRAPGAILIDGRWHQLLGFAPLASLLAIGATLAREVDQEREGSGLLPTLETFGQAVGEQPLLIGSKQVAESLTKPGTTGERLVGGMIGSFVPAAISDIAEAIDPRQRETRGAGVLGYAQKRIPGLRQTLPESQDVLGRPRQDYGPLQAAFDPTRATRDVARQNPALSELVRLDLGLSGLRPKGGETPDGFRAREQEFGRLYLNYAAALVNDPQYRVSSDAVKREVLRSLSRVIKRQLGDDDEGVKPGKLSASSLLEGLRRAERNRLERERGRR